MKLAFIALAALLLLVPAASAGNSWLIQASARESPPDACGGLPGCAASGQDGNTWLILAFGNARVLEASTECVDPASGCSYTVLGIGLA